MFIPVRATAVTKFEQEIFQEKYAKNSPIKMFNSAISNNRKLEENIQQQIKKLETSSLSNQHCGNNTLHHLCNQVVLTPDQSHDLLNFREIGQRDYETGIKYYVIRKPGVKPPKHRKHLQTFTINNTTTEG